MTPAAWQGRKIDSLRELKITARKTCSVISCCLPVGLREARRRMKWSVASHMLAPQCSVWAWGFVTPHPECETRKAHLLTREDTIKEKKKSPVDWYIYFKMFDRILLAFSL